MRFGDGGPRLVAKNLSLEEFRILKSASRKSIHDSDVPRFYTYEELIPKRTTHSSDSNVIAGQRKEQSHEMPRFYTYEEIFPKEECDETLEPSYSRKIFNHLSSRANEELAKAFGIIDINRDNTLSKTELISAVQNSKFVQKCLLKLLGVNEPNKNEEKDFWLRIFVGMDTNEDDKIDYEEFVSFLAPLTDNNEGRGDSMQRVFE